jgi:actin related protein 2/3 complex subunit 2
MSDFDGVSFNVFVDAADLNTMMVSTYMPSLPELMQYGAQVVLDDVYPGLTAPSPRPEFNLTLQFKIDALPWVAGKTADGPGGFELTPEEAAAQEDFVLKISQLKRRLMGGPFDQCFAALTAGHAASLPPIQVHYRPNETVFIVPQVDRIVVVFSIDFPDRTDQAVARVFLQVCHAYSLLLTCKRFLSRSST